MLVLLLVQWIVWPGWILGTKIQILECLILWGGPFRGHGIGDIFFSFYFNKDRWTLVLWVNYCIYSELKLNMHSSGIYLGWQFWSYFYVLFSRKKRDLACKGKMFTLNNHFSLVFVIVYFCSYIRCLQVGPNKLIFKCYFSIWGYYIAFVMNLDRYNFLVSKVSALYEFWKDVMLFCSIFWAGKCSS